MPRRKNEPVDVFKYIDMPPDGDDEPCWPWLGGTGGRENDKRGYFAIGGVKYLCYRVVYTLVYGDPGDEVVRHSCDNGMCCNPHHLTVGTQSDNENDKYDRERWGFPHVVLEKINLFHKQGMPQDAIAALVTQQTGIQVTQQRVSDILTGARRERQSKLIKEKLDERRN